MEFNEHHVKHALIVANASVSTATTPDGLAANEVGVAKQGANTLTTMASNAFSAGDKFHIYKKFSDGTLWKSPLLVFGSYTATSQKNIVGTEQLTYVGYNGSTGSLSNTADDNLFLTVIMDTPSFADRVRGRRFHADYTVATGDTEYDVASAMAKVFNRSRDKSPEANSEVVAEVIINSTANNTELGGLSAATGNISVTNGSKVIEAASDIDGGGDLVAGVFLRFGTSATEALTDPVYEVISVDSANDRATLDRPYEGATNASYDDDFIHMEAGATADAAAAGIVLRGTANSFDMTLNRNFYVNRFSVQVSNDMAGTLITTSTHAKKEVGAWQDAVQDEYTTFGNEGQSGQTIGSPATPRISSGVTSGSFSMVNCAWTKDASKLTSSAHLKGDVTVYLALDGSFELVDANQGHLLAETLLGTALTTALDR